MTARARCSEGDCCGGLGIPPCSVGGPRLTSREQPGDLFSPTHIQPRHQSQLYWPTLPHLQEAKVEPPSHPKRESSSSVLEFTSCTSVQLRAEGRNSKSWIRASMDTHRRQLLKTDQSRPLKKMGAAGLNKP